MSTKNKKIVYYLAAFLVVLMLVCTCLLGNTFARYTTGLSGTATANVAKWNVSTGGALNTSTTYTFDESTNGLSPDKNTSGAVTADLHNYTSVAEIATITIDTETAVDVRLTIKAESLAYATSYTLGSTANVTQYAGNNATPDKSLVDTVFTLNVYYTTTQVVSPTTSSFSTGATQITVGDTGATIDWTAKGTTTTYYVYAWITWNTNYTAYSSGYETLADELDTWIGKNITAVSTKISAIAIQDSTAPTDD